MTASNPARSAVRRSLGTPGGAIINQPQIAILSVDGIKKRPVVVEGPGGDDIVIRPMGILGQSFDHRAMGGAYSGAYLRRLTEFLQTRDWSAELD